MLDKELNRLSELAKARGNPFRVLIVDDEKWIRETFKDFCETTEAVEVDMAFDGAEAVKKVRSGLYDLVTVDLIMPEMSGIEVLNEIKMASPNIPVIVVTGNATEKLVNEAGVMGACGVLYKPVNLADFVSEVASTLIGKS